MSDQDNSKEGRNDEKLFLQALSLVTSPLELEEPLAFDPLEKEELFRACQIIGGKSNIDFITSNDIMLKTDNLIEILTIITNASNARFRSVGLFGKWWEESSTHMLAFRKNDLKPVALIRDQNSYQLIDPHTDEKTVLSETVAQTLSPQAFMFFSVFSKEEDYPWKKALKILFTGSRTEIAYYFIFFFSSAALALLFPYLNKVFFDNVIPYLDTSLFFQVFLALLIVSVSTSLLSIATSTIKLRITALVAGRLQALIWSRVFELSPVFFRSMPVGEILQRVMLIEAFQSELNRSLILMVISGLLGTLYLIPMVYFSWQLSGIVAAIAAFSFFLFAAFVPKLFAYNLSILKLTASLGSTLIQAISGITDIRIFRAEKKAFAYWARLFTKNQKMTLDLGNLSNNLRATGESISMFVTFAIFAGIIIIYRDETGVIAFSLGSFMAFRSAMGSFFGEFSNLLGAVVDAQNLLAHWVRIRRIWRGARKPEFKGISREILGNIEVSNLYFTYEKETTPVLSDVSFKIKTGEFTAIIGPSGCGKSTLLRLLAGIEMPKSGTIYYDHIPIQDIDPQTFKHHVSAIFQTTKVIGGSILDNILCGRKAKKEDILDAIKLSSFDVSLKDLPLGLSTPLPIGGELLSNGQRQRLLLARALLTKPKVLLLDEATSAIDTETEESIINNLLERKVTLCLVTHQPLLLKRANVIYVLDNESIAATGSYSEIFNKYKNNL